MLKNKRLKLIAELVEEDSSSSSDESIQLSSSSSDKTSDTSTESCIGRRQLNRITNFIDVLEKYDDDEFKEHFRLERKTCKFVIDLLKNDKCLSDYKCGRENITPEKAVYITVWYLANTETFRQISDRFGISKSSAHRIVTKVVTNLVDQSPKFIKWPTGNRRVEVLNNFKAKSGIHGIIGLIDGCHIQIKKPSTDDSHVYYNRKSYYSILLQGVCDHEKKFIDVFAGEAGSMHDARLLKKSSLYEKGSNRQLEDDFLLGDSAYPSLEWLVPPFKDNGNLSENQKRFNMKHSSTRVIIEHTFGLLKSRFRRLKFFENNDILLIVKCIVAATVLHNLCISMNDTVDLDPDTYDGNNEDDDNFNGNISGTTGKGTRREHIFTKMFK